MDDRTFKYSILKGKVWVDVIYKGVPMNSKVVYVGTSNKDCKEWLEAKIGGKKDVKKNRRIRKNSASKKL